MLDPEAFGAAMADMINDAVTPLLKQVADLQKRLDDLNLKPEIEKAARVAVEAMPKPKDGEPCDMSVVRAMVDEAVKTVRPAKKGEDGVGAAGAMIDRDGCLMLTLTNGEVKNLGPVVGKDGVSLDGFEMQYLPETHEVCLIAYVGDRKKEMRYPAGGIKPGGYWRDGAKAAAGEAWVHDGSMWIALKSTSAKPDTKSPDWIIGARRGKDGNDGKSMLAAPAAPVRLRA